MTPTEPSLKKFAKSKTTTDPSLKKFATLHSG
jgi:hypothetical protein